MSAASTGSILRAAVVRFLPASLFGLRSAEERRAKNQLVDGKRRCRNALQGG